MLLTGCATVGNQYHCPPEPAYTATGQLNKSRYQVEVECYKSMNAKVTACYKDAED